MHNPNAAEPRYEEGRVRLALENGRSLEATPQECWRLAETLRAYLLDSACSMSPAPFHVVHKNGRFFRVPVTPRIDFWNRLQSGRWEPSTFKILDLFLTPDHVYLDIGSWIGPTVLYGAQLARRTYAFEPDPVAYAELEANVEANAGADWAARLAISNKAIAPRTGTIALGSRSAGGDSTSSVLFSGEKTSWAVESLSLEDLVRRENLAGARLFIKLDIEGGEYELLPALKTLLARLDVTLFLSLHPPFLIDRLIPARQNTLRAAARRRLLCFTRHLKLLRALPFEYYYHADGRPIDFRRECLRALVEGRFVGQIVATNTPWTPAEIKP